MKKYGRKKNKNKHMNRNKIRKWKRNIYRKN